MNKEVAAYIDTLLVSNGLQEPKKISFGDRKYLYHIQINLDYGIIETKYNIIYANKNCIYYKLDGSDIVMREAADIISDINKICTRQSVCISSYLTIFSADEIKAYINSYVKDRRISHLSYKRMLLIEKLKAIDNEVNALTAEED